jgi:hypothetical protein
LPADWHQHDFHRAPVIAAALHQPITSAEPTLASYQDGFLVAGAVALLAAMTSMVRGSAASAHRPSRAVEQQAIG